MTPSLKQRQLLRQLAQRAAPSRALVTQCPSYQKPSPSRSQMIHLARRFSTCPRRYQEAQPSPDASSTSRPTAQAKPPRRRPRLFSATILLLLGAVSGTLLRTVLSPPPPLPPGSPADEDFKKDIRKLAEQLPIVQQLTSEPGWTHHEAYSAFPASSKPNRITSGPLGTAAGIGAYQHIFHPPPHSALDEPIINVLFFGLSTSGWPGVVHGGLISTILDEHSARAALADLGGRGVLTANLDVTFLQPTLVGGFYVAKARALRDDELEEKERGKRGRKIWVDVWLENLEGIVCVRGKALFVIPKGRELRGLDKGF